MHWVLLEVIVADAIKRCSLVHSPAAFLLVLQWLRSKSEAVSVGTRCCVCNLLHDCGSANLDMDKTATRVLCHSVS